MKDTANRLLKLAGALMLIASAVLALLKQRLPAALLAVGALGCIVSGMNFKRARIDNGAAGGRFAAKTTVEEHGYEYA